MQENATEPKGHAPVTPYKKYAFEQYITWRAIGGMIVTDTGAIKAITQDEFCEIYNVNPATVWRWSRTPGIGELIKDRLKEIAPNSRVVAAWNRMLLIGLSSLGKGAQHHDQRAAVDALKTYLGHFGEMETPVQRAQVTVKGGYAELLAAAKEVNAIEGEVVPDDPRE